MPPEDPRSKRPVSGHARRAARIDTRELEERMRQWEADQSKTREDIEAEVQREHWGRAPEGGDGERGD